MQLGAGIMANAKILESTLNAYFQSLPHIPYASDNPNYGLQRLPKELAIKRSHIQHNPELLVHFLAFDIDRADGYSWWEDCGAPAPNYLMLNPMNGHAHYLYRLETFVSLTDRSKPKPKAYLQRVERGLMARLDSDTGYGGLISKNPLNLRWHTLTPAIQPYSLDELADYVDMDIPKPRKRDQTGFGRHCILFDELRWWAYKHVNTARESSSYDDWLDRCMVASERLNTFNNALPYSSLKSTAKSVARWTWDHYTGSGNGKNRGRDAKQIEEWQGGLNLRDKQAVAAQQTNVQRKQNTEQKIKSAVCRLKRDGKRVSIRSVAAESRLSNPTIQKYKELLKSV